MTTFLKVFLIVLCAAVAIHCFPVLMVPVAILGLLAGLFFTVFSGGAVIALIAAGVVVGLLATILLSIATVLAPIALPVLLILGLIALIKSLSRQTA